jgi:hypothetical protein
MFRQEFVNRIQENQPTLLEGYKLSDDDFNRLWNILHVLKPIQVAQRCLEGELYITISLMLPYVIYQLDIELEQCFVEQCFGAANPDADQQALSELLEKMLDDFHARDPQTKKYLSKVMEMKGQGCGTTFNAVAMR